MEKFYEKDGQLKVNYQIARFDGRGCFVEILTSMCYLEKPKMIFRFIKYDETKESGGKYTADISIYVDLDRADALAGMILSGSLDRQKLKGAKTGKTELIKYQGGTTAADLIKKGKERSDKKAEARQLVVEAGKSSDFVMIATLGPGVSDNSDEYVKATGKSKGNGLIVPIGKPEQNVLVAFSDETICQFARAIQRKVTAMDIIRESAFQKKLATIQKPQ